MDLLDKLCLFIGYVFLIFFGVSGALWLATIPLNFAWKRLCAIELFWQVWLRYCREVKGGKG